MKLKKRIPFTSDTSSRIVSFMLLLEKKKGYADSCSPSCKPCIYHCKTCYSFTTGLIFTAGLVILSPQSDSYSPLLESVFSFYTERDYKNDKSRVSFSEFFFYLWVLNHAQHPWYLL